MSLIPDFVDVSLELIDFIGRIEHFYLLAKAQEPTIELVANVNLRFHGVMLAVRLGILGVGRAEAFNHRIQQGRDELEFHSLLPAVIHRKDTLGVSGDVKLPERLFACPLFTCPVNFLHSVDAVGSHFLLVIHIRQEIIVAVADKQFVRADDILVALLAFYLLAHIISI